MRIHAIPGLLLALVLVAAGCSASWPERADIDALGEGPLATLESGLRQRVADHPEDEMAWSRLAWVQLRRGDPESAEQSAWRGVQTGPDHVEGHLVLGWAQWAANRPRRSLGAFGQAIQLDPGLVEARVGLALSQEGLGQMQAAQGTIAEGLRQQPDAVSLLHQSARLHHRLGEWQEATEQAARVLQLQPGHGEASVLLADLLRREGRYLEAVTQAEQVVADESVENRTSRMAREVIAATLIEQGRMDEAFIQLKTLAGEEPLEVDAQLALITILEHRGRNAAAEKELTTLMRRYPANPDVVGRMGRSEVFSGRFREALRILRGGENFTPDVAVYHWRAMAALQLKETDLGDSALAAAERLAPADPAVMLARIVRLVGQGRVVDAGDRIAAFRKTHPGDVRQALVESALAARAYSLGAAEGALTAQPAQSNPAALEFARLRIAALRRNWSDTERLARALREDPVVGWRATYLQGLALLGLERHAEGWQAVEAYLSQAGESAHERSLFAHLAGYLYWLAGDARNAERVLATELARNPDHPLLLEALSRIMLAKGERERALTLVRKGAGGNGPWRSLFQERLSLQWPPGPIGMNRDAVRTFLIDLLMPESAGDGISGNWALANVLFGAYIPDRSPVWHPGVAEPPHEVPTLPPG